MEGSQQDHPEDVEEKDADSVRTFQLSIDMQNSY
jgi:hypothetical protein